MTTCNVNGCKRTRYRNDGACEQHGDLLLRGFGPPPVTPRTVERLSRTTRAAEVASPSGPSAAPVARLGAAASD